MVFPAVKRSHPAVVIIERQPNGRVTPLFGNATALLRAVQASFIPAARGKKEVFFLKKRSINTLETLVCLALLTALQVVLSRFLSIQLWNIKIGFSFVPVMLAANLYGPVGGALVYGVGDLIGALLFPSGAYFPGFTLTAVICGVIWGIFLKGRVTAFKAVLSVLLVQVGCSFLLNSFWISYIAGVPYTSQLAVRWPLNLGNAAVHLAFIFLFLERICKLIKKITKQN